MFCEFLFSGTSCPPRVEIERECVCGVGICLEFYAVADDLGGV